MLLLVFCGTSVCQDSNSSLEENHVKSPLQNEGTLNQLLIETELIRTTNFQIFSKNIDLLSNYQNQFTPYQYCYYHFLFNFRLAYSGGFTKAQENLASLFNKCNDLDLQIRIKSLMANLFVISGNYLDAIKNLDFVVSQLSKIKDKTSKHFAYVVAFIVYDLVNQHELSLKFIDLLTQDDPSPNNLCKALVHKNRIYLNTSTKIINEHQILSAITLCEKTNDNLYAQILNTNWMKYKLDHSNSLIEYKNLLADLLSVEQVIEDTQYKNLIGIKNALLSQIYEKLNDYKNAIKYANLSIEESYSIGSTNQKIDSLQVLYNYYEKHNNFKEANQYLIKKNKAELKVYSDEQAKNMAYLTVAHNNVAKTQEIELLQQQNKVLALEKTVSKKSAQVQKLIILFLVAITGFFIFWGLWQKRNQRIYKELSEHDHMTKIFNRKGLRNYTESLLAYSTENESRMGCAVFDLDFFKKINDQFGHATGDWAIKNVIKKCEGLGNNKATFGRLGGEEFAIILSDANKEEMYVFCENCRNAINSLVTKESGYHFKISASFGMTTSDVSGLSYSDLLIHADDALYKAKKSGRNNTVIYQPNT